ncbi:hypothetical protein DY000_02062783 [Brassica cretica]|uniref:Uncharacterized protein n=1 Tax=Brassica cretica TaxID=69181 RepID=A0ABQ7AZL3_BRACR|nr:hypothetical protein DY000_02062783 [Brassica cretica]
MGCVGEDNLIGNKFSGQRQHLDVGFGDLLQRGDTAACPAATMSAASFSSFLISRIPGLMPLEKWSRQ